MDINKIAGYVVITGLFFSAVVSAAEDDFISELDMLADIPMVSSATRLQQSHHDAPASVTVIDQELIRTSGVVNLADIFRLVPGFQVVHANANSFGVMLHGGSDRYPRRLEVTINGRSVYQPLLSTVEWSSLGIELDDIDRIEVVRGSNVPSQGSNAFFGAINIITRSPTLELGTDLKLTLGNDETREVTIRHAGTLSDVNYRATLAYNENEGFKSLGDGKEVKLFNADALYTPTWKDTFNLRFGLTQSDLGIGDPEDPTDLFDSVHDVEFETSFQEVEWHHAFEADNFFDMHFYHNRLVMDDRQSLGTLSEILDPLFLPFSGQPEQEISIGDNNNISERFDFEIQHTWNPLQDLRMVWGIGIRYDRIESDFLFANSGRDQVSDTLYRGFANFEWKALTELVFNLGFMLEHDDIADTHVSSRAAVNYHFTPQQTIRLAATSAFRTPSLFEAKADEAIVFQDGSVALVGDISDRYIGKEHIASYELAYIGDFQDYDLGLDVRLFKEDIDDAVDFDKIVISSSVNDFLVFAGASTIKSKLNTNMTEWTSEGIETQLRWKPFARTQMIANYTYNNLWGYRIERLGGGRRTMENSTPHHTGSFLLSQMFLDDLNATAVFYRVSPVKWLGGNQINGYSRFDLRLAAPVSVGEAGGEISFMVHNLMNTEYTEHATNNIFERRVYFQLKLAIP